MNIKGDDLVTMTKLQGHNTKDMRDVPKQDQALKQACDGFESFFLKQILQTSLKSSNIAGQEAGSSVIKGMYTDTMAKQSAGSLGISDMLYRHLSQKK